MVSILNLVVFLFLFGAARCPLYGEEEKIKTEQEHVYRDTLNRIVSRYLTDEEEVPYLAQTYHYEGDLVVETLWGNLSEKCTAILEIDEKGFPLRNEIETYTTTYLYNHKLLMAQYEQNGRTIHYVYRSDSDKIDRAIIAHQDEEITIDYTYDEDGNLVSKELDAKSKGWLANIPSFESFSHAAYVIGRTIARASGQAIVQQIHQLYELLNFNHFMNEMFDNPVLGEAFFIMTGALVEEHHCGMVGYGEADERVRVTHINGILNGINQVLGTAQMFSNFHGGVNIHYHHNSTDGFTWDLIGALASRFGAITLQAQHLARTWKTMIEEMGGTDNGGDIIHYAHSLGGADTFGALKLMNKEEKAMISVITFGSPKIVPSDGLRSVTNYVSRRDGIGLIGVVLDGTEHVTWVGTSFGIPLVDHLIGMNTYRDLVRAHGQFFEEKYGMALSQ